jgi:DNA polymerase elongation subunit (family B)
MESSSEEIPQTKKIIVPTKFKSLKLYDFNVYDGNNKYEQNPGSNLNFNPYKDNKQFIIQMFGITSAGHSASILVEGYHPFFYIKVDDSWDESMKSDFISHLRKKIGNYYEDSIVSSQLIKKHKLYWFDNGKLHNFIKINFTNTAALNRTRKIFYLDTNIGGVFNRELIKEGYKYKGCNCYLYEGNIPPLLKLFHIKEISPSGWILLPSNKIKIINNNKKITSCTYEYIVRYEDIKPSSKEDLVEYNICSFDIEASSSHGDFPVPIKNYKKLATNILEYYNNLEPDEQVNYSAELLNKQICTAFGYDDLKYINLVYPKLRTILLEQLNNIFDNFIIYIPSEDKSRKKEDDYVEINDADNDNSDSETEDTIDKDNNDNNNAHENVEIKNILKKIKKVKSCKKSINIIEIIKDDKCEYDTKLNELTLALTKFYPALEGDIVTFIGLSFINYGSKKPYKRIIIVKGGCDIPDKYKQWVQDNNVEIITKSTEKAVLLEFTKVFRIEDPHIVTGYNITGFDFEFMFKRAKELNIVNEFLKLSRNKDEICITKDWRTGEEDIETNKIVLASGEYNLKFIKMAGRVIMDMCIIFRREYILSSYKLDYTSCYFISDSIKNATINIEENTTTIFSKNLTGLTVGCYVKFEEIGYSTNNYKKGKKFEVLNIDLENASFVINSCEEFDLKKHKMNWGLAKDDVSPAEIFKLSNGDNYDRFTVGKYCLGDCDNVLALLFKIDVITGYVEMSNLCSVPLSFLLQRGQGIKLTSFVSKKCGEKNTLMPTIEKSIDDSGYEGAHVFAPKTGLYLHDPVACVDYSSLYPSSIISENLSHDSKVWTKEYDLSGNLLDACGEKDGDGNFMYDNLFDEGYTYVDIQYDTYQYLRASAKAAAKKVVVGYKICRFAQFPDGKKAILPSILEELLAARKATRKMIPLQTDEFMKNVLDKRQLTIKVAANSVYGQTGARTSTFFEKDVAASTTATGRKLLFYGKEIIEQCYDNVEINMSDGINVNVKAECVYGDSVVGHTPIYVKVNGTIEILTVEELGDKYGSGWYTCSNGDDTQDITDIKDKYCKLYCNFIDGLTIESWTDDGWTKLERIIKHLLHKSKNIIRILTYTGLVDVTDDHSLLTEDKTIVSSKDISIGTKLLHKTLVLDNENENENENNITIDEAKIMGFFFGEDQYKSKIIPSVILNSNKDIREAFWEGLYDADGYKDKNGYIRIDQKSQISAANICLLANSIGYNTYINTISDKLDIYRITCTKKTQRKSGNAIKKIINISENTSVDVTSNEDLYVYDLTTKNHHFAAGIGNMIVHNTDSVFFKFNLTDKEDNKIIDKQALIYTIELAKQAGQLATKFLKKPHDLEYEKTFWPFNLLSKKRYDGMLYEDDPEKCKLKSMGNVLKRRDNAPIVKDIYGGVVGILMKEKSLIKAIKFVDDSLQLLLEEKYPIEKLLVTKSLRGYYKNPKQIAHKVLSERIGLRNYGNKPGSGDRIYYAYIKNPEKKALQGEKIETPEFIKSNDLPIDYEHYITNQISKPLQQLIALDLENLKEFKDKQFYIKEYNTKKVLSWEEEIEKLRNKWPEPEKYAKKYEELRCKEVKSLIFDKFLKKKEETKPKKK